MTWAEIEAKYRRLAKSGASDEEASQIAECVGNFEKRSVSEIFAARDEKGLGRRSRI